jgi:hypothetical protein
MAVVYFMIVACRHFERSLTSVAQLGAVEKSPSVEQDIHPKVYSYIPIWLRIGFMGMLFNFVYLPDD